MKISKSVATVLVFSALLIQSAVAEENEESKEYRLDPITVTASKDREYVQDVVTQENLNIPVVSGSVLDALKDQAGIQFQRGSLSGSESGKLRIRGFGETRLRILKDGIPLQRDGSYGNGPVDWSTLSGEDADHIELHRGAGPAKFGNTFGGVVNIITAKPSEKPETRISSTYGSFDTWDSRFSDTRKIGPIGWSLAASHYETDGYLRNSFADRNNVSAKFFMELPSAIEIGAGMTYSDMENGNSVYNRPDSPYYDSGKPDADSRELGGPGISSRLLKGVLAWGDESKTEDENLSWNAFISKKTDLGHLRLDFMLWNQDRHEVYYDAEDSSRKIYERDTKAEDNNWSLQGEAVFDFGQHHVEAGGETRRYGWGDQTVSYMDKAYFNKSVNFFAFVGDGFEGQPECLESHALYVQDTWKLHPKVSLELGLRQEWFKADKIDPEAFGFTWPAAETELSENHLDPRIALTFQPWDTGSIEARFGVVHRYPNSPEYFWWYLNKGTNYFNTDFTSEKARQYELSCEQELFGFMNATIRGYYYDVGNYISSTSVPNVGSVYYNIKEVDIKGAELGIAARLHRDIRAWANVTWQKGDKDGDPWDVNNNLTNQLSDFPEKMFNMGLDYAYEKKFSARLALNFVDSREHFDGKELVTSSAYTLLNLSASYRLWEDRRGKWDILFAAENILDEDYEEEQGYPMPGASVVAGLRAAF